MRSIVLFVCFLLGGGFCGVFGQKGQMPNDEDKFRLYHLASKNLDYNSSISDGNIFELCKRVENQARMCQNYEDLFLAQQITVNSFCLNGEMGLAINEAQKMYEESKRLQSDVGVALSIQAIGDTYMYSAQYKQAYDAFEEAAKMLANIDDGFIKVRLLMQQMHVCMLLNDIAGLQQYLTESRKLLDRVDIPCKTDYIFYLQCYQASHDISIKDRELARISLDEVAKMIADNHQSKRWYYILCTNYYDLISDYEKALVSCDSALLEVSKGKKTNEYKEILIMKARLLAKNEKKKEACTMFIEAQTVSDSLNMVRYSKQIDSLHVYYWVDQIAIENKAIHNRFLAWSVLCALLVLGIIVLLVFIVRRKNTKLVKSRRDLEAIRKEAEESIQSKSMFLSNMSHELRTPLNAIVGFADLLSGEVIQDAESKQQFGERIKLNAELLLKLFNDVADLSGLEKDNITFSYDTYDAVNICQQVIDTVDNIKQTAAVLHFKTTLKTLPIYTDTGRLQQLLINLLVNATKFTQAGTITLILKINEAKQEAVFIVEDTGCGIPLEKQANIFKRFEKLHDSIQGAGLGLSICRLIVDRMGGSISIDPEYTQGARFIFTHPLNKTTKPSDNE